MFLNSLNKRFRSVGLVAMLVLFLATFAVAPGWAADRTNPATFKYRPGGSGNWNDPARWDATLDPSDAANTDNLYPGGVAGIRDVVVFENDATVSVPVMLPGATGRLVVNDGNAVVVQGVQPLRLGRVESAGSLKLEIPVSIVGTEPELTGTGSVEFTKAPSLGGAHTMNAQGLALLKFNQSAFATSAPNVMTVESNGTVQFTETIVGNDTLLKTSGASPVVKAADGDTVTAKISASGAALKLEGGFALIGTLDDSGLGVGTLVLDKATLRFDVLKPTADLEITAMNGGKLEMAGDAEIDTGSANVTVRAEIVAGAHKLTVKGVNTATFDDKVLRGDKLKLSGGKVKFLTATIGAATEPAIESDGNSKLHLMAGRSFGTGSNKLSVAGGQLDVVAAAPVTFETNGAATIAAGAGLEIDGTLNLAGTDPLGGIAGNLTAKNLTFQGQNSGKGTAASVTVKDKAVFPGAFQLGYALHWPGDAKVEVSVGSAPAVTFPTGAGMFHIGGTKKLTVASVSGTPQPDGTRTVFFKNAGAAPDVETCVGTTLGKIVLPSGWEGLSKDTDEIYTMKPGTVEKKLVFSGKGMVPGTHTFEWNETGTVVIDVSATGGKPFAVAVPAEARKYLDDRITVSSARTEPASGDASPLKISIEIAKLPTKEEGRQSVSFDVKLDGVVKDPLVMVLKPKGKTPGNEPGTGPNPGDDPAPIPGTVRNRDLTKHSPMDIPASENANIDLAQAGGWRTASLVKNDDGSMTYTLRFTLVHDAELSDICVTGYSTTEKLLKAERKGKTIGAGHGIEGRAAGRSVFFVTAVAKSKDASIGGVWYREAGDAAGKARKVPFYKPIVLSSIPRDDGLPGPKPSPNSGSGGCNAASSGLILLLALPFIMRKKS